MSEVTITVEDHGPYLVKGPCRVIDAEGNAWEVTGGKAWLSRCGSSASKPFRTGATSGWASLDRIARGP